MKMTLKNRIQLLEVLSNDDFRYCMKSNDKVVVFHISKMVGSQLSEEFSDILMNRNAVPKFWLSKSSSSDCIINYAFKKAYKKIVEYIESSYDITPGRVQTLLEILSCSQHQCLMTRRYLTHNETLKQYLRNLNNLRQRYQEMTKSEIYDFSFDMVYDFIDKLLFTKETLPLSLLIMYWIQRENKLIPLAVTCNKDEFFSALNPESEDRDTKLETKKSFRLFMRKLLDVHLKKFMKNEYKDRKGKLTSRDRIIKLIEDNPTHTAKTMASCLGLSVQAVQKQIAKLKKENRLERIGPDKGGQWKKLNPIP